MLGLCGAMITGDGAFAREGSPWPDTMAAREQLRELIDSLDARLLASSTATAALESWCADHKLANVPEIKARVVTAAEKPLAKPQRQRLQIDDKEPVRYRRVELVCGDQVLSVADNWYVPGRLTKEMNEIVETTDTPFGRAVADLRPYRKTIEVVRPWQPTNPTPECQRTPGDTALPIPWRVLEHRAVVYTGDHVPFAEVSETYTSNILGFAAP